ncbi:MAG TPA: bifunctional riboflavin kinase/FAD synthetase [Acidimicrobiales bacterium]|jgi:riboflavin kinase/FMN adenylyltransferase|nr:bifunctional riboflavin kinase/FAD synthetase [Acidimicrobiales bacterium]
MEILTDPVDVPELATGSALTIGAFDGVHRGHQAVLAETRRLGDEAGLPTVVVTFDRHPASVVRPQSAPLLLTDVDQKLEVLEATGLVDWAVMVTFDAARAAEEASQFVGRLLVGTLGARLVVVGEDFHFGRGRQGNVALLRTLGADLGFDVIGLGLVPGTSGPVSSTAVRRLVAGGDVEGARTLLGRDYEVRGTVVDGDHRGRDLGYPTANVAVPSQILLPGDGIYAGWYLDTDGRHRAAAISVGRRLTFHARAESSVLEAYLLDFDGDLYGRRARVRFVERLRGEERFDSVDALVAQMARDVEATRRSLA